MNEETMLALASLAGLALGAIFFGGLWWTVKRGLSSGRPARWFAGSMLLRMGIAIAGFHLVSGARWDRLLACLAGFIVARALVSWFTRIPAEDRAHPAQEAHHAPQP